MQTHAIFIMHTELFFRHRYTSLEYGLINIDSRLMPRSHAAKENSGIAINKM